MRPTSLSEQGMAVLIALIGLCVLSLIGLFMTVTAVVEVRISDNYESEIHASFAARAGISHARELMRGLDFSDLFEGPDGAHDSNASYLAQARTFAFRNPLSWSLTRTLDLSDPGPYLISTPDDGVVSTGRCGLAPGIVLIPGGGIDPVGTGSGVGNVRYFVKVTDNSGEISELARDPLDNPFVDGDGVAVVRSMGLARTIAESAGGKVRRNSVVVVEARFKRNRVFELDSPLVVSGSNVAAAGPSMFEGTLFLIDGGAANPGIATIDTNPADGIQPASVIRSLLAAMQADRVRGQGTSASVVDITAANALDAEKNSLLNAAYLHEFAQTRVPAFADSIFQGAQVWSVPGSPDLGRYETGKPINDPSQAPRITWVNGDLEVNGAIDGAGVLVVTGRLSGAGRLNFTGLILLIGAGELGGGGLSLCVEGGVFVACVVESGGSAGFGEPRFTLSGGSTLLMNATAIRMAIQLLPPLQLSWREIRNGIDP